VSKFAVVSLHWDLWAVFRGFFCTIEMRAAPALPAILLASIASFSLALWQQLGCVCARAFCVPKFAVGGCPRELQASFRRIFCTLEMRADPALPAILLASIASFSRYGSSWDACVPELSAFLKMSGEGKKRTGTGRPQSSRSVLNSHDYLSVSVNEHVCVYVAHLTLSISLSLCIYSNNNTQSPTFVLGISLSFSLYLSLSLPLFFMSVCVSQ
jgi:hypothetical protein